MNTLPIALPLTPDACADAQRRCLALEISHSGISVLVPGCDAESTAIYAEIALGKNHLQQVKAVEEAVYSNPMLLADFRSVSVLIRRSDTLPVPQGFGAWTTVGQGDESIGEGIASLGIEMAGYCDEELLKFLRRSFNNPYIGTHMSRLCAYFGRLSRRSNRQRAYVQYLGHSVDVLVFSKQQLLLAASYPVSGVSDALYYVLAACETAGFSRTEGEMMLAAPTECREQLQSLLRNYVNYVMPLIIPADLCRQAPLELALAARPNSHD
ncbi:MAG: DUF3822 family protein [Muribaculaceae bacterium]|nr:DUF3822 family protein [Muribaculaceae bacterium]